MKIFKSFNIFYIRIISINDCNNRYINIDNINNIIRI